MGLDGGGAGGGGILGASGGFTGPAEALEITGDFAYAASGSVQDAGTDGANTTLLSFQTGNFIFVGNMDFTNNISSAHNIYLTVDFNGGLVNETKEATAALIPLRFSYIIPPYTEIVVKWGAGTTGNGSVFLAGRIYRG